MLGYVALHLSKPVACGDLATLSGLLQLFAAVDPSPSAGSPNHHTDLAPEDSRIGHRLEPPVFFTILLVCRLVAPTSSVVAAKLEEHCQILDLVPGFTRQTLPRQNFEREQNFRGGSAS